MKIVSKEKKLCSCCMEEHEVKRVHVQENTEFKNELLTYEAEYYYCDLAEELYVDEKMAGSNDVRLKDAYRMKKGLLTSKEIYAVREKYDISQSDFCVLLGWGGKTITRYESHQVQDKAHDYILKKIACDPEWFIHLLVESQKSLPIERYKKYIEKAACLYEEKQDFYLRKAVEAQYACFYDCKSYNGNAQLSLDKVVDVISYFSNSSEMYHLYKVKLMKLLWYADALAYKIRGCAITGLVYQALPMGAVPIGHDILINLKGIAYEEIDMGNGTAYKFSKTGNLEYSSLEEEEKGILDIVIKKFGKMSKDEIVAFMHGEEAYKETAQKAVILFEYAKDLNI